MMSEDKWSSTVKRVLGMQDSIDIDVTCGGDPHERWLFAGTPGGSEIIWLLGGDADEPLTDDAPERRVYDVINHETMHAVISFVEDEDTSDQYDVPASIRESYPYRGGESSMIGRLKCWWKGEHDYDRDERIEAYTFSRDDEIAGRCERCGDVVWVTVGDLV